MTEGDLITKRMRLLAITPAMLHAEQPDTRELARLVGAAVPAQWPSEHWEPHVFALIEQQYAEAPHTLGWHRHLVLKGAAPVLIGSMGAFPKGDACAEIGYSILEPWQRRGLATEGVQALLRGLFDDARLESVIAHTFPHLVGSVRVLERCGFTVEGAGEDAGSVRFRLMRPRAS